MNIYQSLNKVMEDIGAIGKDRKNAQQGFMYRGIEDVMNALQPALIKHGVFVVPEVLEQTREERTTKNGGTLIYSILKVKHHFIATDGSEVCSITIGEGMDSADKASNKAMSIAFKYACFQVLCIPTEEMQDPDAETPEPLPKPKTVKNEDKRHQEILSLIDGTSIKASDIKIFLADLYGENVKINDLSDRAYEEFIRFLMKKINKE